MTTGSGDDDLPLGGESDTDLSLQGDDVHVWRLGLDPSTEMVARLRAILTDDERKRADRFAFDQHRRRFTVGRGCLRTILGQYTGIEPARIRLYHNDYGKPALDDDQGGQWLRFNVSHSGELALYALTRAREVGVDLETIRPDFAGEDIAKRFFAPAEVAALRGVPAEQRCQAFFACWTRKEAYIKARGKGLAIPLDTFEVSLAPEAPAALLATHDDPNDVGRWTMVALEPGVGFAGALAVEGSVGRLRFGDWPL
jgi:4'-phosphopantetheinyl transferase